jgi:hypothetical protein
MCPKVEDKCQQLWNVDFMHMTSQKRQGYGDRNQVNDCQGLELGEGLITKEHIAFWNLGD